MPETHCQWWVIHGQALMDALARAYDGEDPEMVYVELYANSEPSRA
jgi:hypothetical protein